MDCPDCCPGRSRRVPAYSWVAVPARWVTGWLATPPAFARALLAKLRQHVFPAAIVGFLEIRPPSAQTGLDLTRHLTNQQKVISGPKAGVFHDGIGALALPAWQPDLHLPHLLHGSGEAFRNRRGLDLATDNLAD